MLSSSQSFSVCKRTKGFYLLAHWIQVLPFRFHIILLRTQLFSPQLHTQPWSLPNGKPVICLNDPGIWYSHHPRFKTDVYNLREFDQIISL